MTVPNPQRLPNQNENHFRKFAPGSGSYNSTSGYSGKTPPLSGNIYTTSIQNCLTIVTTPSGSLTYTRHR